MYKYVYTHTHSLSLSQVLAAATVIAKHTSVLCNACKVASSKTSNPVAKRHFVQAAKEVANSTANLVKNIKVSLTSLIIICPLHELRVHE